MTPLAQALILHASLLNDDFARCQGYLDLCTACLELPKDAFAEKHGFRVDPRGALRNAFVGLPSSIVVPIERPTPVAGGHLAICDVCQRGIIGTRNKCLDCPDYDECSVCRLGPSDHSASHVFFAMEDTTQVLPDAGVVAAHKGKRTKVAREIIALLLSFGAKESPFFHENSLRTLEDTFPLVLRSVKQEIAEV